MNIHHQPEHSRFVAVFGEQQAMLEYQLMPRRGIDFTYTFVPEPLRGQGIAEKLVKAMIADAREQGFRIAPDCSYVDTYFRRHAELSDLRA